MNAENMKAAIEVLEKLLSGARSELDHMEKCGQPFTIKQTEFQEFLIGYLRQRIHERYSIWLEKYQEEQIKEVEK